MRPNQTEEPARWQLLLLLLALQTEMLQNVEFLEHQQRKYFPPKNGRLQHNKKVLSNTFEKATRSNQQVTFSP